jgi:hypothetical protein
MGRHDRHQRRVATERGRERRRSVLGVRVGEQQVIARRDLRAGVTRPRLAEPARRQRWRRDDGGAGGPGQRAGAVGGVIVDDDDLVRRRRQPRQRRQQAGQVVGLVAGRHDDRDPRGPGRRGPVDATARELRQSPAPHADADRRQREDRDRQHQGHSAARVCATPG